MEPAAAEVLTASRQSRLIPEFAPVQGDAPGGVALNGEGGR